MLFPTCLRGLILGTILLVLSTPANAQTRGNVFRGLTKIRIVVEGLDKSSTDCGITTELLQSSVKYPISSSNLKLSSDDETDAITFYVDISSLYMSESSQCFADIQVQVYNSQYVILDYSGRRVFAEVMLREYGAISSSLQSVTSFRVGQAVQEFTKRFITDWNLDNKDGQ